MGVTQKVSDKVTDATWDVSGKVEQSVREFSDTVENEVKDTAQLAGDLLLDGAETLSLAHQMMAPAVDDGKKSLQDERLEKYGDPSEEIMKKEQVRKQREKDVNPYDYPKALRKYL